MDNYLSNKAGERIDPASDEKLRDIENLLQELKTLDVDLVTALALSPEEDSGQKLTNASADADTVCAVEPGIYVFDAVITGGFYFGLADVTTAKNVRWACGVPGRCLIKIPAGEYELHYATSANSGIGYLRKLT